MRGIRRDTSCLLNRSGTVVWWAQPFLDCLHSADPSSSIHRLVDLRVEPRIYLLPETISASDAERLLCHCFDTSFTAELGGWLRDESTCPAKRTFGMFREWFEYSYHSELVDLAKADLTYE